MLNHLLVPLDTSLLAESVLPHVVSIAKAFKARITLLHVLEQSSSYRGLPKADPLDWYLKRSAASAYLDSVQLRLEAFGLPVETRLVEGNPAQKIVERAHSNGVDLLVLSGYGERCVELGTVSVIVHDVLQRVRISTLIIRMREPLTTVTDTLSYKRLLVTLDGSQRAGCALTMAAAFVDAYAAECYLIHVVNKPEMVRHTPLTEEDTDLLNRFIARNQEEGARYLEQTKRHLPTTPHTRLLVSDDVAGTILHVSEEEKIDLMVSSAHGYSGEATRPFGSTTGRFIVEATAPLLIVQDLQKKSTDIDHTGAETRLPVRLDHDK